MQPNKQILELLKDTFTKYILTHDKTAIINFDFDENRYRIRQICHYTYNSKILGIYLVDSGKLYKLQSDNSFRHIKIEPFKKKLDDGDKNFLSEIIDESIKLNLNDYTISIMNLVDMYNSSPKVESCMRDKGEYYELISDLANGIVMKDKRGHIVARAIAWKKESIYLDDSEIMLNDKPFIDKLYAVDGQHRQLFRQLLSKHNCKLMCDERNLLLYDTNDLFIRIPKNKFISHRDNKTLPYMDTFSVISTDAMDENNLILSSYDWKEYGNDLEDLYDEFNENDVFGFLLTCNGELKC